MTLDRGAKLEPYEVETPLGAGGMGEVYRARDTRLDRIVAIKIIPPNLATKPDARERFEREARTVSALNDPHICHVYDVGQQDGIRFLVMEYLEGETLAARLTRGALPMEQVLRYGAEIASGLARAHCAVVVHRDLKPGNIMLTGSGAKLATFLRLGPAFMKWQVRSAPSKAGRARAPWRPFSTRIRSRSLRGSL